MDYAQNYLNTSSLADRIRQGAASGQIAKAGGGLAAREKRREVATEEPDFAEIRAEYFNSVRNMFSSMDDTMTPILGKEELSYGLPSATVSGVSGSGSSEGLSMGGSDFLSSLIKSESSGNAQAFRTNKDGETYAGLVQIGKARIADYNKATGSDVTQADLLQNSGVQAEVINWHVNDLRKLATKLSETSGMDINGLIAVGHLGGRGGMTQFANTAGKYNKQDELGTSLSDYYSRFKSK
jgi:hypothetical protein